MKCIIIEDQPPAQRILKRYIADTGSLELMATFTDAIQAMEFLKHHPCDLIFLDINLPKMSGLDLLRSVPQLPEVILTTAYPEYALESYEFAVVDYLLKPFSFQRFVKAVSRVKGSHSESESTNQNFASPKNREEIYVKSGYEHIRLLIKDIVYIKSDADYCEIHLPGRKHLSSEPLRYWQENLESHQFVRLHKSYIVNTTKIVKVYGNQVYLTGQTIIPIGRAYREEFAKRFLQ